MTEQHLMDPERQPSLAGVKRAAKKIAAILPETPLLPLEFEGKTIWCKAECLQPIGAFKIRGGWHRLTDLSGEQRPRGVVAFSSGNHAQGVAWAARRLGIPATIVMPEDAPRAKLDNTRALGAEVVTYDRMGGAREQLAADLAKPAQWSSRASMIRGSSKGRAAADWKFAIKCASGPDRNPTRSSPVAAVAVSPAVQR